MSIWCDLTNTKDKSKLLNELRRGNESIVDVVTVDEQWPILPNLGVGHVGTYPGTSNIKMIEFRRTIPIIIHIF